MQPRVDACRLLLAASRRTRSRHLLRLAKAAAGADATANAAVYYVAMRYFWRSPVAIKDAVDSLLLSSPTDLAIVRPLSELSDSPHQERIATVLRVIDGCLEVLSGRSEVATAFLYARAMLTGDFRVAFRLWSEMASTGAALDAVEREVETHPPSPVAASLGMNVALGVVLPGTATAADLAAIAGHPLVARTGLGRDADIVFLNRERFRDLCFGNADLGRSVVVAKSGPDDGNLARLSPHMQGRVSCELRELPVPMASTTYLTVMIAAWTMASFKPPATFFCGDFYLGDESYQNAEYDPKKRLSSIADVRWSYFAHDVFFAHAALSRWLASGRIAASGRLEAVLRLSGAEFSELLAERWGNERST